MRRHPALPLCLTLLGLPLAAQIGKPVPVTYEVVGNRGDFELGSIKSIAWGDEAHRWRVEFHFPQGWNCSEGWKGSDPHLSATVTAPDGTRRHEPLSWKEMSYALEEVNGAFVGAVPWEEPHHEDPSCQPIYPAERYELGQWELHRVIWRVGGCSGNPPMLFLLLARDMRTGSWCFKMGDFQYPPAPDGKPPMRLARSGRSDLDVTWWNYHGRNTAVFQGLRFTLNQGTVSLRRLREQYSLYTRNGAVATLAATPAAARHLGYQEAAWALDAWDTRGGVARAFAKSPRRLASEEDRFGAPLLPVPGTQPFQWAAELYLVPWGGKAERLPLAQALARLGKGRWDVVLFRNDKGQVLGQRLVEHHHAFPHSTPR